MRVANKLQAEGAALEMSSKLTAVEQVIQQSTGRLDRRLFVIAGPSGVGKNTIIRELLATHPEMARVKTYTTRARRDDEFEGEQYYFVLKEEFVRLAEAGELMEADADNPLGHDVYNTDHSYSMPRDIYRDIPPDIHIVLAEVDIVGAKRLREAYPTCVDIFVTAPPADLLQRIRQRADVDMTSDDLQQRIATARTHIEAAREFDYVIFNQKGHLCEAVGAVEQIIAAERMKVTGEFDLKAVAPDSAFDVIVAELSANGGGR